MALSNSSDDGSINSIDEWEVFVCNRSLREMSGAFYKKLPPKVKDSLRDLGICHYMTIFKSSQGKIIQFDFGPNGGDISFKTFQESFILNNVQYSNEQFANIMEFHEKKVIKRPGGEIREQMLPEIPSSAFFVGKTRKSLSEIREFNKSQNTSYVLNKNDCRHYVDSVVQFATGMKRASAQLMRHLIKSKCSDNFHPKNYAVQIAQRMFEKESTALIERSLGIIHTILVCAASLKIGAFLFKTGGKRGFSRVHFPAEKSKSFSFSAREKPTFSGGFFNLASKTARGCTFTLSQKHREFSLNFTSKKSATKAALAGTIDIVAPKVFQAFTNGKSRKLST